MEGPPHILIVRPSALGDVARTVPALVSLKRANPDALIDWLVNDTFAPVIAHHPDLNEIIVFPRKQFSRFGRSISVTRRVLAYCRDLRRRRYRAVYDLQGLSRSGWLTWATRSPLRIGPADARELAWLAYNRRVKIPDACTHTVDRMLTVVEADGVPAVRDMRLHIAEADRRWADEFLASRAIVTRSYAVIAPTAAWKSKRWPIDRFNALIDQIASYGIRTAIIVGAPGEEAQTAPLTGNSPSHTTRFDLTGRTTVGQIMAIIEQAALVVANDSAALHIAMGLGRRCVGVFGPTDSRRVGPYGYPIGVVAAEGSEGVNYRAVRDDQSLIATVSVEKVMCAIERVLRAPPPVTIHDASPRTEG